MGPMHRARVVILIAAAAILGAPSCPAPSESRDPLPVRTHEPSPAGSTLVYLADFVPSRNGSLTVVAMPSGRVVNRLDGRSSPPPTILPGTRYAFLADLFSDTSVMSLKLYRTDLFTGLRTQVVDVGEVAAGVAVLGTIDGERAYVLNASAGDGDRQVRLTGYDGSSGRLIAEQAWPLRSGETANPQLAVLEDGRLLAATRVTAANGLSATGWTVFDRDLGRGIPVAPNAPELAGFIRRDGCDPRLRQTGDGRLVTVCGGSAGAVAAVAVFDKASLQLVDNVPIGAATLVPSRSGEPAGLGSQSVLAWSIGGDGLIRVLFSHLVTATVDIRAHRVIDSVALDLGGASLDRSALRLEPVSGRLALILDSGSSQRLELVDLARPNDRATIYTASVIRAVREAGDHFYVLAADSRDSNERLVELDRATGQVLARSAPLPRHASAIVMSVAPSR